MKICCSTLDALESVSYSMLSVFSAFLFYLRSACQHRFNFMFKILHVRYLYLLIQWRSIWKHKNRFFYVESFRRISPNHRFINNRRCTYEIIFHQGMNISCSWIIWPMSKFITEFYFRFSRISFYYLLSFFKRCL